MSAVIPFIFEGIAVRGMDRDGQPWFVLTDVCRVLELGSPHKVAERLDEEEKSTIDTRNTNPTTYGLEVDPRVQALTIINESGLYSLILTSRKQAAKRFKKWVTSEVLPEIRRTGRYETAAPAASPLTPVFEGAINALEPILMAWAEDQVRADTSQSPILLTDSEAAFVYMMRSTINRIRNTLEERRRLDALQAQAQNAAGQSDPSSPAPTDSAD